MAMAMAVAIILQYINISNKFFTFYFIKNKKGKNKKEVKEDKE